MRSVGQTLGYMSVELLDGGEFAAERSTPVWLRANAASISRLVESQCGEGGDDAAYSFFVVGRH
jgi:hypothetical protein